jgi:hypothetical protein
VDHVPDGVLTELRADGHELVVRRAGVGTELVLDGVVALGEGWNPDRPALGPDGVVAFVSGRTGIASVYVLRPGQEPVQLTNVGLERLKRRPGEPPPGFVPPPMGPLSFEGHLLSWDGPDGPHEVRW